MAERRSKGRVRNALRVYLREMRGGGRWWWVNVPNVGRKALNLPETTSREDAYKAACERYAEGSLAARADGSQREATLEEVAEAFGREEGPRYKPRSRDSMSLRVNAFVEAMQEQRITRPSQIIDEALAKWVAERMDSGVTNGTINRTLVVARVMLRWAAKRTPRAVQDHTCGNAQKPPRGRARPAADHPLARRVETARGRHAQRADGKGLGRVAARAARGQQPRRGRARRGRCPDRTAAR